MRELSFLGLDNDGSRLVLAGKDGQQYALVIDERLVAAIRRDRSRMGQIEIELEAALRPKEIQARIRAGATAEEVSRQGGIPLERVRRFEGPVLAERAWVADQARGTELRRNGRGIILGEIILETLEGIGVDIDALHWDAWRREDGRWHVRLNYPTRSGTAEALWVYDTISRTIAWDNELAQAFTEGTPLPAPIAEARPRFGLVMGSAEDSPHDDAVSNPEEDQIPEEDSTGDAVHTDEIITAEIEFPMDDEEPPAADAAGVAATAITADPTVPASEVAASADTPADEAPAEGSTAENTSSPHDARADERSTAQESGEETGPATDVPVAEAPAAGTEQAPADPAPATADDTDQESLLSEAEVISLVDKTPALAGAASVPAVGKERVRRSAPAVGASTGSQSELAAAISEGVESGSAPAAPRKSRRAQVPSWDDILFGTKPNGE